MDKKAVVPKRRRGGQATSRSSSCHQCVLGLLSGGSTMPLLGTSTTSGLDRSQSRKALGEGGRSRRGPLQASNSNSKYWGSK